MHQMHPMIRRHLRGLHSWPASPNPTPYEIFGMSPSTFDKKNVKSTYLELAKTYHPDRCQDQQQCQQRFKMIGEAYNILISDSKRSAWDTKHFFTQTNPVYPPQFYRRQQGSDPYDPDLNMDQSDEKFRASLQENRWFFLKVVVSTVVLVGLMELTAIFKASDKRLERLDSLSERASRAHSLAFNNYHKGSSAQDRIDRFLAQREYTLSQSPDFRYAQISHPAQASQTQEPTQPTHW